MYSTVMTSIVEGINTLPIFVEADISDGMPMFDMVGNLGPEVREARERVRTALHNCGIILPAKRITINLAPGNIRKNGTAFDLPIAIGILSSMGIVDERLCNGKMFVGELNLRGEILPVNGVFPMVSDGVKNGCRSFVVPLDNMREAELAAGAEVYGFSHLKEIIEFLNDGNYTKRTFLKAQETGEPISLCCAIGDETIDGKPYGEIVQIARDFIADLGGFEAFAEWGLF